MSVRSSWDEIKLIAVYQREMQNDKNVADQLNDLTKQLDAAGIQLGLYLSAVNWRCAFVNRDAAVAVCIFDCLINFYCDMLRMSAFYFYWTDFISGMYCTAVIYFDKYVNITNLWSYSKTERLLFLLLSVSYMFPLSLFSPLGKLADQAVYFTFSNFFL